MLYVRYIYIYFFFHHVVLISKQDGPSEQIYQFYCIQCMTKFYSLHISLCIVYYFAILFILFVSLI